jgi:hypothetical protein
MADTHNLNSAIDIILKENGVTEIKHVTISERRDASLIRFEDQRGKKVEMNVSVKDSTRCCNNCK